MKRTVCLILSMLLLLGLSACTAPKPEQNGTEGAPTAQPEQTEAPAAETEAPTAAPEEVPLSWDDIPVNDYRQEEITVDLNGQTITGAALIPELEQKKYPLVICCHELGSTYESCMDFAELMASHGIAACCFEFRGVGANKEISAYAMSMITEAEDTLAVIAAAAEWSFVDPERIVLYGRSMGGAVAAIAAARSTEQVNGLILCYAALTMPDRIRDQFASLDEVPSMYPLKDSSILVGKAFAEDIWDYDILAEIGSYTKPVLILHGTVDTLTPIAYMEQAAQVYPDAVLYKLEAGHGFNEARWAEANAQILGYLQEIGAVENN